MDFAYEVDTFDNNSKSNSSISQSNSVSLKLSSLSTADFTKRLQSLSLLGGSYLKSNNDNKENNNNLSNKLLSSNAKSFKRAKNSIDLLNSLDVNYSFINSSSINNNDSYIDLNDTTIIQSKNLNGTVLVDKLNNILESQDGYDASIKNSLSVLESRIENEIISQKSVNNNNNNNTKEKTFTLQNLTSVGTKGDLSRRNLRGLIEDDLINQYTSQLKSFKKIVNLLENLNPKIQLVNNEYNDLINQINYSIDNSKNIKNDISQLEKKKKQIEIKKNILMAFKSTFTISQYEEHLIRYADLNDATNSMEFFTVIDKIKNIQNNSDVLLGMENEKLGLKIMNQMNNLQLIINERIISYVQKNIDYVYSGNSYDNNLTKNINFPIFQKFLIYLWKNNKENFNLIMEKMTETRSRSISNEFINKLKGYSDEINAHDQLSTNKKFKNNSLYLSSYDTVRFISDTLAYVHSLLVNEMENAKSFFNFDFSLGEDNNDQSFDQNGKIEFSNMIGEIVINIVSGLNNSLKSSVEHILRQESKLSTLVNSFELIELYSLMYHKLLYSNDNKSTEVNDGLSNTMEYLKIETQDRIFFIIKLKLKKIEAEILDENNNNNNKNINNILDETDIIPDWIVEWCTIIDELLGPLSSQKYDDNNNDKHAIGLNDEKWNLLLELLVNKPIEIMDKVKSKSSNDKKQRLIWNLNCTDYLLDKVDINPLLSTKSQFLKSIIDKNTNELINLEFTGLLQSSGLFDIYNLVNMIFKLDDEFFDVSFYQPILENKLFNITTFQIANSKLEEFFANYINQNELNGLMSPKIFNKVFFDSSLKFIDFYNKLSLIVKEYLRDSNDNEIKVFQWDDITIATLLGIEEYYQQQLDQ